MKRLFVLLLVVLLTACGGKQDCTTLCSYIGGEIQPGPGGWYEVIRHTDDTIDIVYTDILSATRSPLGGDTAIPVPHGAVGGIFVTQTHLYYFDSGFPQAMGITPNPQTLYQFSLTGSLENTIKLPDEIFISTDSAVITDGEMMYFVGDCVYSFDPDSLAFEKSSWQGDAPLPESTSDGWVIVPVDRQTVYVNNGFYKIADIHYSIIKKTDFDSGKDAFIPIENHIEYR